MPYKEYDEEDYEKEWEPVILTNKKEKIVTKPIESNKEIIESIIKKRTDQKLTQLQLNQKCKFIYKYTIRDIENGKNIPTLSELRIINLILDK